MATTPKLSYLPNLDCFIKNQIKDKARRIHYFYKIQATSIRDEYDKKIEDLHRNISTLTAKIQEYESSSAKRPNQNEVRFQDCVYPKPEPKETNRPEIFSGFQENVKTENDPQSLIYPNPKPELVPVEEWVVNHVPVNTSYIESLEIYSDPESSTDVDTEQHVPVVKSDETPLADPDPDPAPENFTVVLPPTANLPKPNALKKLPALEEFLSKCEPVKLIRPFRVPISSIFGDDADGMNSDQTTSRSEPQLPDYKRSKKSRKRRNKKKF